MNVKVRKARVHAQYIQPFRGATRALSLHWVADVVNLRLEQYGRRSPSPKTHDQLIRILPRNPQDGQAVWGLRL